MFERSRQEVDVIEKLVQDGGFNLLVRRLEIEGEPTEQDVAEISELFAMVADKYDLTPDQVDAAIHAVHDRHKLYQECMS